VTEIFDYSRHHVFERFLGRLPTRKSRTEDEPAYWMGLNHPEVVIKHFPRDTDAHMAWLAGLAGRETAQRAANLIKRYDPKKYNP
jgi:hypothetical protein